MSNNVENIYTDPNDCWVEVEFTADNDEFIVRRYKTPRTDMTILINGEDRSGKGIRESQQLLRSFLPELTSQLIGSIIILGQGLPYRFTYNTPSARKTLLESLTKSDYMVQTIKDKLDNRKEELRLQLRSYEDMNVANVTQTKIYSERLTKLNKELEEYNECSSDGNIEESIEEINDSISHYEKSLKSLNKKKLNLDSKIDLLLSDKMNVINEGNRILSDKLNPVEIKLSELRSRLVDEKSNEKQLEKEINKLESIVDVCPTCGQKIPDVHKIDTTDLKNKLNGVKLITKSLFEDVDKLNAEKTSISENHTSSMNETLSKYDNSVNAIKKQIESLDTDICNTNKLVQIDTEEKSRLVHVQENYTKVVNEILEINNILDKLSQDKSEIDQNIRDTNEHLNVVQSLITLAKREFRSALLVNVVAYMDRKAKEYARDVFGYENLSIVVNDNYIDVVFNNKYYEALSGGEKQKVDIIIQLALRDLLSNQLNIHSNILVLDEGLDFLDSKGSEAVLNLIQSRLTDVESVFIISHHVEELNISYDTEIIVEKGSDGISNISIH